MKKRFWWTKRSENSINSINLLLRITRSYSLITLCRMHRPTYCHKRKIYLRAWTQKRKFDLCGRWKKRSQHDPLRSLHLNFFIILIISRDCDRITRVCVERRVKFHFDGSYCLWELIKNVIWSKLCGTIKQFLRVKFPSTADKKWSYFRNFQFSPLHFFFYLRWEVWLASTFNGINQYVHTRRSLSSN